MRHRYFWGALGVLLLGVAALLGNLGSAHRASREVSVKIPRAHYKARRRPVRVTVENASADEESKGTRPDPLLVALSSGGARRDVVIVETQAFVHSPVGELLVQCMMNSPEGLSGWKKFKSDFGFDPLELDRIALENGQMLVTGDFKEARFSELGERTSTLGAEGVLYDNRERRGVLEDFAVWNNELLVFNDSKDDLAELVTRLESRQPPESPPLAETELYGDLYGVMRSETLRRMLSNTNSALADRLVELVDRFEFHVDASHDIGISAVAKGKPGQDTTDLAKSIVAALAAGRVSAGLEGNEELAALLESAKVEPGYDSFRIEFGLPLAFVEKFLSSCKRTGAAGTPTEAARP